MDGSRLWNAAAALGVDFREFTTDAGVDILSFGGTKNGLIAAEAIVVLEPRPRAEHRAPAQDDDAAREQDALPQRAAARAVRRRARASPRPATRTRWRRGCAARSRRSLADGSISGLGFSQPTQANAVFAVLDNAVADRIRERVRFYDWDRAGGEVRWMCAFDTTEADVDSFVEVIRAGAHGVALVS